MNELNIELNVKIKEFFKTIIKKKNVQISYGVQKEKDSISFIEADSHKLTLTCTETNKRLLSINNKYDKLLPKNFIKKINKLNVDYKIEEINKKLWYLKALKPFYGNLYTVEENCIFDYKITYNSIIIKLTKQEYDKMIYYIQYVYKLKQLKKINSEINIEDNYTIVFDDEKTNYLLFNKIDSVFNNFI